MTDLKDFLQSHRLFTHLNSKQLKSLVQHCRVLQCPMDSTLFYANRGALRRLGAHTFGQKEWGFPWIFWKEYGALLPLGRKVKNQKALLVLRRWWPLWLVRQLPFVGIAGFSLFFPVVWWLAIPAGLAFLFSLLLRHSNGLFITPASVIVRIFKLRGLHRQVMKIPLEQIKALEIQRRGIIPSILRVGSLAMKTSSLQGSFVVPQIRKPERAEQLLNSLREQRGGAKPDRLTRLKEAWQRRKSDNNHPKELFQGSLYNPTVKTQEVIRFKKSPFVLFKHIFIPLLIWLLPLSALVFQFFPEPWNIPLLLLSLPPLGLLLYRWEDWRNDIFKVAGDSVFDVDKKPLGKEMTRRQTQLVQIENITARQKGFASWLFNAGSVRIILPGETGEFEFEDVKDPWFVQDELLRLRTEALEKQKMSQQDERFQELLDLADLLAQELR
jgi:hypothetical protein